MSDSFKPSKNCWQILRTNRAAVLVDGKEYYQALHEAILQARRSIFILGWDLHSEVRLIRNSDDGDDTPPSRLGKILDFVAKRRQELEIYLLSWDFAMIYALEREFFPRYKLTWRNHHNIHFRLDGCHPIGGSQHQKVVVIDDALAFAGGLDVSKWRWDTSEHRSDDPRRLDPDGKPYPPFHDIQMVVDGPAAKALGDLARERWQRAAGKRPPDAKPLEDEAPWPQSVEPAFVDIDLAIARTMPSYQGHAEIREVERLYLDTIAAARHYIYIENQYLSSYRIGEALQASLSEESGPEIVMVLPEQTGGWLEQHTMDVLRGRILSLLRQADDNDRLRIYYPRLSDRAELMVHAKLMVIDDRLLRVGSSNLSNRSLGLDSECDLAVAARPDSADERTIAGVCNRLLAEHLGVSADEVAQQRRERGSLIEAIEALGGGDRTLVPLDGTVAEDIDRLVPESELLDPEKPIEPAGMLDYFVGPRQRKPAFRHLVTGGLLVGVVLGLAAAWRWTPLSEWLDIETIKALGGWLKEGELTPLLALAAFIIGGCAAVPVTLMVIGCLIIFGPWWGFFYAVLGTQLSALCLFFLARALGKDVVDRFADGLVNRLNRRLSNSGLIAVIGLRIVPVAPFSVINLIAGVSRIRWRDYQLGTLVGMLPAITALAAVTDRLAASLRNPDIGSYLLLVAVVAITAAALTGLRLWWKK